MEHGSIGKYLLPVYHSPLKRIHSRVLAVVDNVRVAHGNSLLEIISAKALATTHHMRDFKTKLS